MAKKRFTDTDIWDDVWFRKLPCEYKTLWRYVCDKCDNAGVWKKDFEAASFYVGAPISEKEALEHFNKEKTRINTINGGEWQVIQFISFQYGELKPQCIPHKNVLSLLKKHGLKYRVGGRVGVTLQEKEKEKEEDKDKDKEEEKEKERTITIATLVIKESFLKTKKEIYPMLNIEGEIRKCVDWHTSKNTHTVKTKRWEQAITNWLKKSYDDRGFVDEVKEKKVIIQDPTPERPQISAEQAAIVRQSVASLNKKLADQKAA